MPEAVHAQHELSAFYFSAIGTGIHIFSAEKNYQLDISEHWAYLNSCG